MTSAHVLTSLEPSDSDSSDSSTSSSSSSSSRSLSSPTHPLDPSQVCTLWIIRHGERADEVMPSRLLFYANTERARWHDPPLTSTGHEQADYVAHHFHRLYAHVHSSYNLDHYRYETRHHHGMKQKRHDEREYEQIITQHMLQAQMEKEMEEQESHQSSSNSDNDTTTAVILSPSHPATSIPRSLSFPSASLPFTQLYVSPLLRTLQTAAIVGRRLHLSSQIVYGLSECAANVRRMGVNKALFYTKEEASHACRKIPLSLISHTDDELRENFATACERLCHTHMGSELLLISHREAIRDLLLAARVPHHKVKSYSLRYCCVAAFQYHVKSKTWHVLLEPTNLV